MCRRLFDSLGEIHERIVQASYLLLCLDFDGTLAEIAKDPTKVFLSGRMRLTLQSLSRCLNTSVAIISGRERADLQSRVDIPGLIYAGNHGLEISGPGFIFVEPGATARRATLEKLIPRLERGLEGILGARVEDKGLTVTVHYRQAAASEWERLRQITETSLADSSHLFHMTAGDKVYEIRPHGSGTKGTAVGWIKERLEKPNALVTYVGDDATDEDAFRALGEDITVKVGCSPQTAAQYQLDGPADVQRFLEWLAQCRIADEI
jgi:trehalose 6-phosphate phosphatase